MNNNNGQESVPSLSLSSSGLIIITTTLISDLTSPSTPHSALLSSASRLRHLSKTHPSLRPIIAGGALPSLLSLLSHSDPLLQEHSVTTLFNLSLSPPSLPLLTPSLLPSLLHVLKSGTPPARANAACTLFHLAKTADGLSSRIMVASGAIPGLIGLMETGNSRGKKDAITAMFMLCRESRENVLKAVEAGMVRVLVGLVEEGEEGVADKAGFMVWKVVELAEEGRVKMVDEGGIGVMVDVVELGTKREKEIAVGVLLEMCEAGAEYCGMVAREGAVPSLIALLESGTIKRKKKVERLIEMLRNVKLISRELILEV